MPFQLTPAVQSDFVDREELLAEILPFLKDPKSRNGLSLYGRRRMGKTSLMLKIVEELEKTKNVVPVYISLWELKVKQIDVLSGDLITQILQKYAPHFGVKEKIKTVMAESKKWFLNILKHFKLSVELEEDISTTLSLNMERKESQGGNILLIPFQLGEELAKRHKYKTAFFVDEFPDLMDFEQDGKKAGIQPIKNIRSFIERAQFTSLSIAGSVRSTMKTVAIDQASPFYRQFVNREVKPFRRDAVFKLLAKHLKTTKTHLNQLVEWMMDNTNGIPFYIQCFGRMMMYTHLDPIAKADGKKLWEIFLQNEAPIIYESDMGSLHNAEKIILIKMAQHNEFNFSLAQEAVGRSIKNAGQTLISLTKKGVLENPRRGIYSFSDRVFQKYMAYLSTKDPI